MRDGQHDDGSFMHQVWKRKGKSLQYERSNLHPCLDSLPLRPGLRILADQRHASGNLSDEVLPQTGSAGFIPLCRGS